MNEDNNFVIDQKDPFSQEEWELMKGPTKSYHRKNNPHLLVNIKESVTEYRRHKQKTKNTYDKQDNIDSVLTTIPFELIKHSMEILINRYKILNKDKNDIDLIYTKDTDIHKEYIEVLQIKIDTLQKENTELLKTIQTIKNNTLSLITTMSGSLLENSKKEDKIV